MSCSKVVNQQKQIYSLTKSSLKLIIISFKHIYFLMDFNLIQTLLISNKMDYQTGNSSIVLIYHDLRGAAQIIREVLYYLEIPFKQILIGKGQTLMDKKLKYSLKIDDNIELPSLLVNQLVIQDCFAIIKYICKKANRLDLIGNGVEERAIVRQIYYSFFLRGCQIIRTYFQYGEESKQFPEKKDEIAKKTMMHAYKQSKFLKQLVDLRLKNIKSNYIFGHLTLLDFLLHDGAFYQVNFFGHLQQKECKLLLTLNSILGTELTNIKNKGSIILKILRETKQIFESEPFYVKNKAKLESYPINCTIMTEQCKKAVREVWLGPSSCIK